MQNCISEQTIVLDLYNVHTHSCIQTLMNDFDVVKELFSKLIVSCHSNKLCIKWLLNTVLKQKCHERKKNHIFLKLTENKPTVNNNV